jgi:hypothetical protein
MSSLAKPDTKTFVTAALVVKSRDSSNATEFSLPPSVSLRLLSFRLHIHPNESTQDCVIMAMDWSGYGMYTAQPMEEVEDDEDFYTSEQDHMNGNNHMHTAAGAASAIAQVGVSQPISRVY